MSDPLKFVFEMVDQMSGPSRHITQELKAVQQQMRAVDREIKGAALLKMTDPLQRQATSLAIQRSALESSAASAGEFRERMEAVHSTIDKFGMAAIGASAAVLGVGYEFAKSAVEVASFAEDNKVALGVVTGSQGEANDILKEMIGLAAKLPISDQVAMGAATRFMMAGFQHADLRNMVTAMSDIQGLNPGRGVQAMDDFANIMTRIKSAGLNEMDFHRLTMETHINPEGIRKSLVGMGYMIQDVQTLKKMITSGSINKDDFLESVLGGISAMTGGKGVGNLSGQLAHTFTGLMSTLEGRKFALMIGLDTEPGWQQFKGFLNNLVDATDPSGPVGKEIAANLAGSFNDLFGDVFSNLSGPNGAQKIGEVIRGDVIPAFKDLATVAGGILEVTTTVVHGWAQIISLFRDDPSQKALDQMSIGQITDLASSAEGRELYSRQQLLHAARGVALNTPNTAFDAYDSIVDDALSQSVIKPTATESSAGRSAKDSLGLALPIPDAYSSAAAINATIIARYKAMQMVGQAHGDGMVAGMQLALPDVADAGKMMGEAASDATRDTNQIRSPSKVFQQLGEYTAQGYANGIEGGIGNVEDAIGRMAAPRVDASIRAGGDANGRPQITVPITVEVDARGATSEDAHDIATAVEDALPAAVVRVFDMLSTQYANP